MVAIKPLSDDQEDYGHVEDGFGSRWKRCKPDCAVEVVRPGKVQCVCDYDDAEPLSDDQEG